MVHKLYDKLRDIFLELTRDMVLTLTYLEPHPRVHYLHTTINSKQMFFRQCYFLVKTSTAVFKRWSLLFAVPYKTYLNFQENVLYHLILGMRYFAQHNISFCTHVSTWNFPFNLFEWILSYSCQITDGSRESWPLSAYVFIRLATFNFVLFDVGKNLHKIWFSL